MAGQTAAASCARQGCPVAGAAPENSQCAGNVDNDSDGKVNDGCPSAGTLSEAGNQLGAGQTVWPKP